MKLAPMSVYRPTAKPWQGGNAIICQTPRGVAAFDCTWYLDCPTLVHRYTTMAVAAKRPCYYLSMTRYGDTYNVRATEVVKGKHLELELEPLFHISAVQFVPSDNGWYVLTQHGSPYGEFRLFRRGANSSIDTLLFPLEAIMAIGQMVLADIETRRMPSALYRSDKTQLASDIIAACRHLSKVAGVIHDLAMRAN